MEIFNRRESEVRSYCRSFPVVFEKARGSFLFDSQGKQYIDFFSGAGSLNYGHNNPRMKETIIKYMQGDGITHSLDMATAAKREFLEKFETVILNTRGLDYKVQFCGPTGANANEAAMKLARAVKKRSNIVSFTNGYHGLTSGALSVTGNSFYRNEAFINRLNVAFMPYDGYFGDDINTIDYLRRFVEDSSSGLDLPAAIITETIQAEGGINVAHASWLQELEILCKEFGILLIVDDIQVGCGRTGSFFSFEDAGIKPDLVTLSKSVSGFGLPMSIVLIKTELDQWKPGEHTGTFRGNNLAFLTAAEAIRYWETPDFSQSVLMKGRVLENLLLDIQARFPELCAGVRGRGLIYGLDIFDPAISKAIAREAFNKGLIVELCGTKDNVLKVLPSLTIEEDVLAQGVGIIDQAIKIILSRLQN